MSRPSRRQVWSPPPPEPQPQLQPQVYASVPQASPPRASSSYGHGSSQQGHYYISQVGGPRPARTRSNSREGSSQNHGSSQHHGSQSYLNPTTSSHNIGSRQTHRRTSGRTAVAQGVASGQIGSGYGPYSYNPQQSRNVGVYGGSRFSQTPSEGSSSTHEHAASAAPLMAPQPPPRTTTVPQHMWDKEPDLDDALHNPDPRHDDSCTPFSWRGWVNAMALFVVTAALLALFLGYPVFFFTAEYNQKINGFNIGGINASGQIPVFPQLPRLIDPDTPKEVYSRTGNDGFKYSLVFSDEFNRDGRTFYPGDDPFWEAVDLHYWPTGDWEWYDPNAITTENGSLVITMIENLAHDLNFQSGMLQSWNKMCFTTGYVEVAISLPLTSRQAGLWPGAWTLGNLGRAGYGATTEGTWPYTYDSCDTGTFPEQTARDGSPGPNALTFNGAPLSSLPGQKLSACSCPGSDHPGPRYNFGRGAPEVDIIEAEINQSSWTGLVSQSFQVAPFNYQYNVVQTQPATQIYNTTVTSFNSYTGGPYQQAVSALSDIGSEPYNGQAFATYGFELWSNPANRQEGFITWYSDGTPSWTITSATVGPDNTVDIGQRLIPEEPLHMILNLGMAFSFQQPDFEHLTFPAKMYVDYVRVYQRPGVKDGLTCDPPNRPTAQYINDHIDAYMNPNLTQWKDANFTFPRNSLYDGC